MKKLLFAVNDTQECSKAAQTLLSLFGKEKIELTILHVTSDTITYADLMNYESIQQSQEEESSQLLKRFHDFFAKGSAHFKIQTLLKAGNPIDVVLEVASEHDLLVIGASEHGLLHRIFNSHQNSFINASPISVLVAK